MDTPIIEGNLAMTETFMILPATLAVLAFVIAERRDEDRRFFLYVGAGVLMGVAAGYKQVAVLDLAAIALMVWLTHERPLRALAPLAGGFAAPQIVLAALFVADGAFGAYWYAVVGSLGLYADLAPAQNPFVRFCGFLPALLALAWLVRRRQLGEPVTLAMFPALWLGCAVAGTTSSTFPFPHYLQQAAPPLALALVSHPMQAEREQLSRALLAVAAVLVAAVITGQFALAFRERRQLDPVDYYRTFASHRWGTMSDLDYQYYFDGKAVAVNDIVRYMKEDGAGTSLYTWSELPWIYAAGGFTNPTRYYTSFLGEVVPGAKPEILRDLDRHPPVYVLVSDDTYAPFDELSRFLANRYALIHEQGDWRLYRLASAQGRLTPASSSAGAKATSLAITPSQ
jgi:4-amino-4-deoxy-L-arabinose transferase-like glycosyltransferase